jgi:prepilin-type N-terminal cleavage/methylation domain-containing protein
MNQLARRQSGVSLVELAIVLIIVGILVSSILQGQILADRATVKALANELRSVRIMMNAYRDQFGALPGDDKRADIHVRGTNAYFDENGLIDGYGIVSYNWIGREGAAFEMEESSLFWQHVRLAGLARGNPARGHARNVVGGFLGVTAKTNRPTTPAGVAGLHAICTSMISGKLARLLDAEMDDGNAMTGQVFAAAENAPSQPVVVAKDPQPYDDTKTFTVCWAV